MYPNFDEILEELSYKVGIVDLTIESHKQELVKLLRERKIDSAQQLADRASVVFKYIKEVTKKDPALSAMPKDGGKLVYFGSKEAKAAALKAGTHTEPASPKADTPQTAPKADIGVSSAEKNVQQKSAETQPEPEVDYNKLSSEKKKKIVDAKVAKNNAAFDEAENKQEFAIKTISGRNEDINNANMLPPGTPGSSLAENNGAKYINNFFNTEVTLESEAAAVEEIMKTPLAQTIEPESVRKEWAQVAVRTAVNEVNTLKNVPSYNAKNPQPEGLPQGAIMDRQNHEMVKKLLETKRDEAIANGDKKTEKHYNKQLGYLAKLEETDTGIIYETNDGTIGFKHTSNKKTFQDPHSNSSPAKVMAAMRKELGDKLSPELEKTFKESEKLLANSKQSVINDTRAFVEAQSKKSPEQKSAENEAIGKVLTKFPTNGGKQKDYLFGKDGVVNQKWFKDYAKENGLQQPYTDLSSDAVLDAVFKNAASDNPSPGATDLVLKISEMVEKVNPNNMENYAKKYGITTEELAGILKSTELLKETGKKRKEVVAFVHKEIVKGIQEADASDPNVYPNNPNGENGPHQQAYVGTFMDRMHFTAYIMGERDGVSSHNIDGRNVEPSFYRECFAQLTGFKGDTETPEGREALATHMRKGLRLSPENDSITFQDGKTKAKVGTETYRTKGKNPGVLGYLGPDLQKCLSSKTQK
jgi:hypothetical protein